MTQRQSTMQKDYDGLRSFLAECEKLGEVKVIKDADWNLEIGALTETVSEMIDEPPALMVKALHWLERRSRPPRACAWRSRSACRRTRRRWKS